MQPPTQPRLEDFGLSEPEAARLHDLWFPPITGEPNEENHAICKRMSLDGELEGTSVIVRALRVEHVAGAGAICGGVYGLVWALLNAGISVLAIFLAFFAVAICATLGSIVATLGVGLLVRPLYIALTLFLVPKFRNYLQLRRAFSHYAAKRREYDQWRLRTLVEFWQSQSGIIFEREVAGLYKRSGYQVTLTPGSSDGGVDIVLRRGPEVIAVQCKAIRGKVGISVGRELVTAAKDIGANRMMIACTNGVSPQLYAYAHEKGIDIVTAEELVKLQAKLDGMPIQQVTLERTKDIAARLRAAQRAKRQA